MAVVKWVFHDPVTLIDYTFEINPNDGGSPAFEKNIIYESTTAPQGKTLVFEGADKPQKLSFAGVILYESQYQAFLDWWRKRYQIDVTDDLGRTFSILIEAFRPARKRSALYPWKHDYTIDATILDWPA